MSDCVFVNNNLEKWMKDESAPDIPLMNKALSPKIKKDPLGAVYIIGYAALPRITKGNERWLTSHAERTTSPSN